VGIRVNLATLSFEKILLAKLGMSRRDDRHYGPQPVGTVDSGDQG
jgi:hypothetical protein